MEVQLFISGFNFVFFNKFGDKHLQQTNSPPPIQGRWYFVLQRLITPSAVHLCGGGFTLQQDNEAKCASKLCNNNPKIKDDQAETLGFSST